MGLHYRSQQLHRLRSVVRTQTLHEPSQDDNLLGRGAPHDQLVLGLGVRVSVRVRVRVRVRAVTRPRYTYSMCDIDQDYALLTHSLCMHAQRQTFDFMYAVVVPILIRQMSMEFCNDMKKQLIYRNG